MASATSFFDFKPLDSASDPTSRPRSADHDLRTEKGETFDLANLRGQTVLVVNTASKCGFTPQFDGLEKLHKELSAAYPGRFTVLGFPCNQFAAQDPGSDDDIQSFCRLNYGVSFPVLAKVEVNGDAPAPVWDWLKGQRPGIMGLKRVKWNFEKFLVASDGTVKGRWASTTKPESLKETIVKEIEKSGAAAGSKPQAKAEL